jgi:hypothetical protein
MLNLLPIHSCSRERPLNHHRKEKEEKTQGNMVQRAQEKTPSSQNRKSQKKCSAELEGEKKKPVCR